MVEKDKLEIIYQMVVGEIELTRHNLELRKITREDIEKLLGMNTIEKIGKKTYQFKDFKGLYEYGIKLLERKNLGYAFLCFSKAYQIAPYDKEICIQFITELLRRNNYKKAFIVYNEMVEKAILDEEKDNNIYLCLFSRLMRLEDKYNKAKYLSFKDVLLPNKEENQATNEIRKLIMHSKYTYAYSLLNQKINNNEKYEASDMLMKMLLSHVINKDKKYKKFLLEYAKGGYYEEIVCLLKETSKQKYLNKTEICALKLCETIIESIYSGKVNYYQTSDSDCIRTVYEAIMVEDYRLAMERNIGFLDCRNEPIEDDLLHILLSKLNMLIDEKNSSKNLEDVSFRKDNLDSDDMLDEIQMNSIIKDAEEWAYYLMEFEIGVDSDVKQKILFVKYALLVKLMLAKKHYLNGDYRRGDKYFSEIEKQLLLDEEVKLFLDEVKGLRNSIKLNTANVKKLTM